MNKRNPFEQINELEVPQRLKQRVMTSVELSQLFMEVTDLFTTQMGRTALQLFSQDDTLPNDPLPPSAP